MTIRHFAVRSSLSAPTYRAIEFSEFQATRFGERQPYVFGTRRQAEAVAKRLNAEPTSYHTAARGEAAELLAKIAGISS